MAKFTANNNSSIPTRLSPFFALRGLHLRIIFDIVNFSDIKIQEWINKKKTIDISESMQSI